MGTFRLLSIGSLVAYLAIMSFLNLRFDQTPRQTPTWCICRAESEEDPTKGTWIKSTLKQSTGEWCDVDEYVGRCNPQTDFMPMTTEMMRPANLSLFILDLVRSTYLMVVGSIVSSYIALHALLAYRSTNSEVKKAARDNIIHVLPEVITISLLILLVILSLIHI